MGKIGKEEEKYASLESQLGNACCMTEDTEEMFWLRESDDYSSRVRLGNLLAAQYRFREAVEIYRTAEKIRWDDPMLYIRLGGALLTLRRFDEAKEAYKRSFDTGIKEKTAAYPMGVWHYLRGEYAQAASWFGKCLPWRCRRRRTRRKIRIMRWMLWLYGMEFLYIWKAEDTG
ncbi:MAG: tetratricopeptide repeat protein [Enterocloster sp.]